MASEFVKLKKELKKMLVENEATITEKLVAIEHGFASKIDEVKNEIKIEMKSIRDEIKKEMKVELDHVKDDITTVNAKLSSVEESLNFQEGQTKEKLKKLKVDQEASMKEQETRINKANADLDTKLKELDVKLQLLEKQDRKYNLLFYGFHEVAGENVFGVIRNSLINDLHLDEERVRNMYFAAGHRIPTKSPGPQPIILRCTSIADRELILSAAKNYKGLKKRVLIDLPQGMKNERSRIATAAYHIRKNEEMQTRIKDKGLDVFLEVRKTEADDWVKRLV